VATDDFSAGACAAQVLSARAPDGCKFAVLSGPPGDQRSLSRVNGFLSRLPGAKVIAGGGWFGDNIASVAQPALRAGADGIFCVNDRIAAALLECFRRAGITPPAVVGHDNASLAEQWHLTTIAIPWEEMAASALEVIRQRLRGDSGPARQVILAQRPVFRLTA
jgi:DNA-binding LacI/PurR family transcriptional regulator